MATKRKDDAGNKDTDDDKVAELLNNFLSSVFSVDGDEPSLTLEKIKETLNHRGH